MPEEQRIREIVRDELSLLRVETAARTAVDVLLGEPYETVDGTLLRRGGLVRTVENMQLKMDDMKAQLDSGIRIKLSKDALIIGAAPPTVVVGFVLWMNAGFPVPW